MIWAVVLFIITIVVCFFVQMLIILPTTSFIVWFWHVQDPTDMKTFVALLIVFEVACPVVAMVAVSSIGRTTFDYVVAIIGGFVFSSALIIALVIGWWPLLAAILGLFALLFGKDFLAGLHYFFVPHPADPYVLPALYEETRIDVMGLGEALTPNDESLTRPPPVYQSENQAEKARALAKKLEADAEIARAAVRREQALAALMDAEREVKEAKKRAKKP